VKKIILVLSIVLIFIGCDTFWFKDSVIINESSYDITFKAKKADQVIVKSGASVTIQNDIGAVIEYFESCTPKRVEYIQTSTYTGKFINLLPIPVIINNTMSIPVTLLAGGYFGIDPMGDIPTGENNVNTIYTTSPTLTVMTSTFPAIANFQVINEIMYIIIR